eukprot:10110572-Ditylum_brightwellii.AAC.1
MNLTNITAKKSKVQGFFVLSHGKFSNRKRAHTELTQQLLMHDFDFHVHSCKHNFQRDAQVIVFVSDPDDTQAMKGKLYRLNNTPAEERVKWPHTGHWKFVPFTVEGDITDAIIANMFRIQNSPRIQQLYVSPPVVSYIQNIR